MGAGVEGGWRAREVSLVSDRLPPLFSRRL